MNNKARITRLEEKAGLAMEKSYLIISIGFEGLVCIWEMYGQNFIRDIPSDSEAGRRILFENNGI